MALSTVTDALPIDGRMGERKTDVKFTFFVRSRFFVSVQNPVSQK